MKNKKRIVVLVVIILIMTIGVSFAFYNTVIRGNNNQVLIAGDIYMNYVETNQINITDAMPMSKETALNQTNNVFNFTISGKNTSTKDIFYGISLQEGDEIANKIRINPNNINVYLTTGEDILLDAVRYDSFGNKIYVGTIPGGTNSYNKNYSLRLWIDENTLISDTDPNSDYTLEEWNNIYFSLRVNVDGNLNNMNVPLQLPSEGDYMGVENGKAYFTVILSNELNQGNMASSSETDTMELKITGTNNDILFTYKDSRKTQEEGVEPSASLNLDYEFTDGDDPVEIQVYMMPVNDADGLTDINIELTRNETENYKIIKRFEVKGNNYCLNNGFNKLGDCLLISENYDDTVPLAKQTIVNKGAPNLDDTAPSYRYISIIGNGGTNVYTGTADYQWYFSNQEPTFNNLTGKYSLSGVITADLSSNYIGWYTCGVTNINTSNCSSVYQISDVDVAARRISASRIYSSEIDSVLRSEVGLYGVDDDYGKSYIYRGDVQNNNVYFGGYYWKVLRINGDGSIRLLMSGTGIGTGQYNDVTTDLTYLGYMHAKGDGTYTEATASTTTDNFVIKKSSVANYSNIVAGTRYYFGTNYTYEIVENPNNPGTYIANFSLDGEISEAKTFTEMNNETSGQSFDKYKYSCVSTSATGTCRRIIEIISYINQTKVQAKFVTYGPKNENDTIVNSTSSLIKKRLDTWYQNNIVGHTNESDGEVLTNYIVDGTFCNDRSRYQGDGYSTSSYTTYAANNRLIAVTDKTATLRCLNQRDAFSKTASRGNALLDYPVGLITIDEVALAGAKYGYDNRDYYIRSGNNQWTMSPSGFDAGYVNAGIFSIATGGNIYPWSTLSNFYNVHPVINITSNTLISQGYGTLDNPYILKLT